jgi:inosine-uridine nucleoside N-ribohydrolase
MSTVPVSPLWIDTDFGFDDLWALLVLRHLGANVAGISLVAGNAPLTQVISNALGARQAYGFDAPIYEGTDRPLVRDLETAERILGPRGMLSRGQYLPDGHGETEPQDANTALKTWLSSAKDTEQRDILAIGPLTNIARIVQETPDLAAKITRIIWMGGSDGAGNHSAQAEFNALADPEAAAIVAGASLQLDVVDLMFCRTITFGAGHLPDCDDLTSGLLGGYLDIALDRGRPHMAIYDPVAALVACQPHAFIYENCDMDVSTIANETYGKTTFTPNNNGSTRRVVGTTLDAVNACLSALPRDHTNAD